jgi:hypothetical protein
VCRSIRCRRGRRSDAGLRQSVPSASRVAARDAPRPRASDQLLRISAVAAPVAEAGLVVDIAGAWALALSFMAKRSQEIVKETTTLAGWNPAQMESIAEQTADAQVGAVLLTLGFAGQFASSIGWTPSWATMWLMLSAAAAVSIVAFAFLWWIWRPDKVRNVQQARALTRDV